MTYVDTVMVQGHQIITVVVVMKLMSS